jgi:hypothetical protein
MQRAEVNINEWIVLLIYVELLRYFFLYLRSIEKVCVSYYIKVEIRDVNIFAIFFNYWVLYSTSCIWFMLVVVTINQNVFTVTYVFFTVTNFPFRHELKNVLCIDILVYSNNYQHKSNARGWI